MIGRAVYFFKRYCHQHASVAQAGFPLLSVNEEEKSLGYLDRIVQQTGRLTVEGWTLAEKIGLMSADQVIIGTPTLERNDVLLQIRPHNRKLGFRLEIPAHSDRTVFWLEKGGTRYVYLLPAVTWRDVQFSRMKLLFPFFRDSIRALPWMLRWILQKDPRAVANIKTSLKLNTVLRSEKLNISLFAEDSRKEQNAFQPPDTIGVTIILPIYNAFDLLPEVLDRVCRHTDLPWRLIVIEDCSSDAQVRPWLRDWHSELEKHQKARVTLIENEKNLGFIGSVNRGFDAAQQYNDHVVLLNSDAFVPSGWASRLIQPLLENDDVATVTPFSNDAEIFNAPVICKREMLMPGEADAIDLIAQKFSQEASTADAPTGVGFCMAMNINYLKKLPALDTAFGRGYGEEVDWCQRIRKMGGRNLGTARLFVEHRGGTSFGSAEKTEIIRNNSKIISIRYPNYDQDVQDFIRSDPLATPRLALAIEWAGERQKGAIPVYLAHDMGGGAENYLQNRIKTDLSQVNAVVVLRVGGVSRWQIELHCAAGVTRGETDDTAFMQHLLHLLPERRLIYSCGVGDHKPTELPQIILELASGNKDSLEILVHDYFMLSPSYTLLNSQGRYEGVPDAETNADLAHETTFSDGSTISLAQWREAWLPLIQRSDRITVFSEDSRTLMLKAYPVAEEKTSIQPHKLLTEIPRVDLTRNPNDIPVIGILGNIGLQKGASVLRDLSAILAHSKAARLVVIGNIDPAYPLTPPAITHGNYEVKDIPALIGRYGISCWLIPSIWPETFSYTTHEALATGLPVFSFDLGAQGDAVKVAKNALGYGGVITMGNEGIDLPKILDVILSDYKKNRAQYE